MLGISGTSFQIWCPQNWHSNFHALAHHFYPHLEHGQLVLQVTPPAPQRRHAASANTSGSKIAQSKSRISRSTNLKCWSNSKIPFPIKFGEGVIVCPHSQQREREGDYLPQKLKWKEVELRTHPRISTLERGASSIFPCLWGWEIVQLTQLPKKYEIPKGIQKGNHHSQSTIDIPSVIPWEWVILIWECHGITRCKLHQGYLFLRTNSQIAAGKSAFLWHVKNGGREVEHVLCPRWDEWALWWPPEACSVNLRS